MQGIVQEYVAKFPRSKALYEKALGVFPRGVTHDGRFVQPFPIYIARSSGSHKWDVDGYEYIDYWIGHSALILGMSNPTLIEAISEQVVKGTHYGASHELEIEWANLIKKLIPSAELVEFTNSGTEANMLAIRLARAFTGREKIATFQGHFFGWYDSVLTRLTEPGDIPVSAGMVPALMEKTIVLPENDEEALDKALSNRDVAVLCVEAGGKMAGYTGTPPHFYEAMRQITKKYGTLLLFDEVVTGFRFSPGGVQALRGVTPDLTSLGKCIGGGLGGVGAVVGRSDVMNMLEFKDDPDWNRYKRVDHPGTFNANPLCAAAGIATLKALATGEPQKVCDQRASQLRQGLEHTLEARGIDGCLYGECSSFHLYLGKCDLRDECDRVACLNTSKVGSPEVIKALDLNMILNGVTLVGGPRLFGMTSTAHSEGDVDHTILTFGASLDRMMAEGALGDLLTR